MGQLIGPPSSLMDSNQYPMHCTNRKSQNGEKINNNKLNTENKIKIRNTVRERNSKLLFRATSALVSIYNMRRFSKGFSHFSKYYCCCCCCYKCHTRSIRLLGQANPGQTSSTWLWDWVVSIRERQCLDTCMLQQHKLCKHLISQRRCYDPHSPVPIPQFPVPNLQSVVHSPRTRMSNSCVWPTNNIS